MYRSDWLLKLTLMVIAILLAANVLRPYFKPDIKVLADSGRFDYVSIVSPLFLYKGHQGVLMLDKRNGDIWFIGERGDGSGSIAFREPVFVVRLPLEKLDEVPR